EATYMDARQHDNRIARIHADNEWGGEAHAEVGLARGQGFREPGPLHGLDVVDLGKPLAPEEFFDHVLGGNTDAGDLDQPKLRRFGWWLRGARPEGHTEEPRHPRERHLPQEPPPAERSRMLDTHGTLPSRCW